jgi:hypothetical protein
VARVLSAEGRPIPVPTGVVEPFISSSLDDAGLVGVDNALTPGQYVRVVTGPFTRSKGVLEHLDGGGRVRILMEIMGGAVTVAPDGAQRRRHSFLSSRSNYLVAEAAAVLGLWDASHPKCGSLTSTRRSSEGFHGRRFRVFK